MTKAIQQGIQRVIVAFDNSRRSTFTLETAAVLAADLQAELRGLFVEDENLLRLAEMPFACEIGGTSATSRPLNRQVIERTFRAKAEEARRALIENAQRVQVHWDFQVCRGQLLQMTIAAAEDAVVTIVEPQSAVLDRLPYNRRRLDLNPPSESSARSRGRDEPRQHIVVIVDGSSCAFRALHIALQLSRSLASDLIVFLAPMPGISVRELGDLTRTMIDEQLLPKTMNVELVSLLESTSEKLDIRKQQFRLALLNRDNLTAEEPHLQLLIQHLHCPLAFVR
jgi:nucleotide-binding universal stress UspA family protein